MRAGTLVPFGPRLDSRVVDNGDKMDVRVTNDTRRTKPNPNITVRHIMRMTETLDYDIVTDAVGYYSGIGVRKMGFARRKMVPGLLVDVYGMLVQKCDASSIELNAFHTAANVRLQISPGSRSSLRLLRLSQDVQDAFTQCVKNEQKEKDQGQNFKIQQSMGKRKGTISPDLSKWIPPLACRQRKESGYYHRHRAGPVCFSAELISLGGCLLGDPFRCDLLDENGLAVQCIPAGFPVRMRVYIPYVTEGYDRIKIKFQCVHLQKMSVLSIIPLKDFRHVLEKCNVLLPELYEIIYQYVSCDPTSKSTPAPATFDYLLTHSEKSTQLKEALLNDVTDQFHSHPENVTCSDQALEWPMTSFTRSMICHQYPRALSPLQILKRECKRALATGTDLKQMQKVVVNKIREYVNTPHVLPLESFTSTTCLDFPHLIDPQLIDALQCVNNQ